MHKGVNGVDRQVLLVLEKPSMPILGTVHRRHRTTADLNT
jgi:hypothetical protein